jgi:protein gp37
MAKRLGSNGKTKRYLGGFKLTLHHDKVDEPKIKKGVIFVNSMSDLFS